MAILVSLPSEVVGSAILTSCFENEHELTEGGLVIGNLDKAMKSASQKVKNLVQRVAGL